MAVAGATDARHFVESHDADEQRQEQRRPRAGAAPEIEHDVGAEQAAIEEVQRLDVVPPHAPDDAARNPRAG
jgi:hypothetical protein